MPRTLRLAARRAQPPLLPPAHNLPLPSKDHDGSHIKGLIMNFMHTFYPSLLKIPGFLVEFITPIIKVRLSAWLCVCGVGVRGLTGGGLGVTMRACVGCVCRGTGCTTATLWLRAVTITLRNAAPAHRCPPTRPRRASRCSASTPCRSTRRGARAWRPPRAGTSSTIRCGAPFARVPPVRGPVPPGARASPAAAAAAAQPRVPAAQPRRPAGLQRAADG